MKDKSEQRLEVIKEILSKHGSLDSIDAKCLGVRFGVKLTVIGEDIRTASEMLQQEASARAREAELARERQIESERELQIARAILKGNRS
jgi:hypothetical protein